jgi:hypothetical protein
VEKRKELGERSRRARGLRGFAVLSALGLGVLGLAAPARAGDPLPQPPPSSTGSADLSVRIVADVPEEVTPAAQPAAPAPSPPAAPDGAPVDDAVRPVETPANEAPAVPSPEPTPPVKPAGPAASAAKPPTVSSEPVRAAPAARPIRKAAREHRAHAPARQYQRPAPQYQPTVAAPHEIAGGQSGNGVAPAVPGRPPDIKSDGWNCSENIPDISPLCPPNACQSSSWNCCWIDTCTSGIPVVETPSPPVVPEPPTVVPEPPTQPAPPACAETGEPGTQYQPGEGQYQPPAGPGEEESGDEPQLDPCEQAPVAAPGAESTLPAAATTSDMPDAVEPASSPVVPGATAVPSQPPGSAASAASTPPPDAPPLQRAPTRPPGRRPIALAPTGAVLGETVYESQARPADVVAHAPRRLSKPSPVTTPAPVKALPQAERAIAGPARPATSVAGGRSSLRFWFAFAAVALVGLAFSSFVLPARALPRAPTLAGVRSRIGSKGLDANASVGPKRPSRGIRYRD